MLDAALFPCFKGTGDTASTLDALCSQAHSCKSSDVIAVETVIALLAMLAIEPTNIKAAGCVFTVFTKHFSVRCVLVTLLDISMSHNPF